MKPIRCRYCSYQFVPQPVAQKSGKKAMKYIECPRCGDGDVWHGNVQRDESAKKRGV